MDNEGSEHDGDARLCRGAGIERVRLTRCSHGCFHLYLGAQTLHLNVRDLMLMGQAINRWVHAHPEALHELDPATWQALDDMIHFE